MTYRFTPALGLIFALAAGGAQAAPTIESTPAPRPKKPDFTSFAFFVGTWSCIEKQANRPSPSTMSATWAFDDSGYWLTNTGHEPPVTWFPYDSKSESRITYDSDAKLWVFEYSDNLGGYGFYTTPGWSDGKAVWTARSFIPTKDISAVSTYTMAKISDSKYTGTFSYTNAKGTAIGGADSCTKI